MPKSNLAANTPNGRKYIQHEIDMLSRYSDATGTWFVRPDDSKPAEIDGFGVDPDTGRILFGYEAKSRNVTLAKMQKYGSLLISHNKIANGQEICSRLYVPFVLLVYCIEDGTVLRFDITDAEGNITQEMETKMTWTQATANGGKAKRLNSFLPVDSATIIA